MTNNHTANASNVIINAIVVKRNLSKRRSVLQSLTIGTTNKSSTCVGSLALGSNSNPIGKRSKWHDSTNVKHIVWAQQKSERTCTCDQPGKGFEQKTRTLSRIQSKLQRRESTGVNQMSETSGSAPAYRPHCIHAQQYRGQLNTIHTYR